MSPSINKISLAAAFACALFCPLSAAQTSGPNMSALYPAAMHTGTKSINKFKPYKLLFVPGFMSDLAGKPLTLPTGRKIIVGQYFNDQINWAKSKGIEALRVDIESENPPSQNAQILAREILNSEKPVILVTHSKGGLDTLELLIKHPDLKAKIKGWVAIQAPFYGCPWADYLFDKPALNKVSKTLLTLLGGNISSLDSLRMETRKNYMRDNAREIENITANMPVLCVVSWNKPKDPFLADLDANYKSDGVVPAQSQKLPGARYIEIPGLDHLSTVMPIPFCKHDRPASLKAFLFLLLK
ncbi:MAG: hypothetical protein WCS77_01480 [Elusimicrobiaceae bacterium]|jgi:hypothetical protein